MASTKGLWLALLLGLGLVGMPFARAEPPEVEENRPPPWMTERSEQVRHAISSNELETAETVAQEWLREIEAQWGEGSREGSAVRLRLGEIAKKSGRPSDAIARYGTHYDLSRQFALSGASADLDEAGNAANQLGRLYRELGHTEMALHWFKQAQTHWSEAYKEGSQDYMERAKFAQNNLAMTLMEDGKFAAAESEYRAVLGIYTQLALKDDVVDMRHRQAERAVTVANLSSSLFAQGRQAEGIELLEESARDVMLAHGNGHPHYMLRMARLGERYRSQGNLDLAVERLTEAEFQRDRMRLPETTIEARVIDQAWVNLHAELGDLDAAIERLKRVQRLQEDQLKVLLATGSESEKREYVQAVRGNVDQAIGLHLQFGTDQPELAELALRTVLQRKGRVVDVQSDAYQALRRSLPESEYAALDAMLDLYEQRDAAQRRRVDGEEEAAQKLDDIQALQVEIKRLEHHFSSLDHGFAQHVDDVQIAQVAAAIPEDSILIEFVAYRPIRTAESGSGLRRYAAYTLDRTGQIGWADLGEADAIDAQVRDLISTLSYKPPLGSLKTDVAQGLYASLLGPLCRELQGRKKMLLSPDGALSLLNFEVLVSDADRLLIHEVELSYLTSGRDLLRLQESRAAQSGPVIVANPIFSLAELGPQAEQEGWKAQSWKPLPGTEAEAVAIQEVLTRFEPDSYLGEGALEETVFGVQGPVVLHFATHGRFSESQTQSEGGAMDYSALVLSGASSGGSAEGDGYLQAREAVRMDLGGSRLVVLSGCGTGVGVASEGEGVYGLRRSFVLAGAETVVSSLWKVFDESTPLLMQHYYANLTRGHSRTDALRRAKLSILESEEWSEPYYWAVFISSGAWEPVPELQRRSWRRIPESAPASGLQCQAP